MALLAPLSPIPPFVARFFCACFLPSSFVSFWFPGPLFSVPVLWCPAYFSGIPCLLCCARNLPWPLYPGSPLVVRPSPSCVLSPCMSSWVLSCVVRLSQLCTLRPIGFRAAYLAVLPLALSEPVIWLFAGCSSILDAFLCQVILGASAYYCAWYVAAPFGIVFLRWCVNLWPGVPGCLRSVAGRSGFHGRHGNDCRLCQWGIVPNEMRTCDDALVCPTGDCTTEISDPRARPAQQTVPMAGTIQMNPSPNIFMDPKHALESPGRLKL